LEEYLKGRWSRSSSFDWPIHGRVTRLLVYRSSFYLSYILLLGWESAHAMPSTRNFIWSCMA
jgi:hypothetical protein